MPDTTQIIALLVLVGGLTVGASFFVHVGSSGEKTKQVVAQAKQNDKVRKIHAKVKRDAPGDSDKPAAIEWLSKHTRK